MLLKKGEVKLIFFWSGAARSVWTFFFFWSGAQKVRVECSQIGTSIQVSQTGASVQVYWDLGFASQACKSGRNEAAYLG